MHCSKCGSEVPDQSDFCLKCGSSLANDTCEGNQPVAEQTERVIETHSRELVAPNKQVADRRSFWFMAVPVLLVVAYAVSIPYLQQVEARAYSEKRYGDSLSDARLRARLMPWDADPLISEALALVALDRFKEAVDASSLALKKCGSETVCVVGALSARAAASYQLVDYKTTFADLNRAIELEPNETSLRLERARISANLHLDSKQILADLDVVRAQGPFNPEEDKIRNEILQRNMQDLQRTLQNSLHGPLSGVEHR